MHEKRIFLLLLGLLLTSLSCTENLNLTPTSDISGASFWKTESDARGGLYGMYVRLRAQAQTNFFLWGEGRSEVMDFGIEGAANLQRYFQNTLDPVFAGPNWLGLYTIVHDANLILKNVPAIPFASEPEKASILAQAHATRAFVYFIMVRTWGDVPLVLEPTEGYDPTQPQKSRSPKADVFASIKKDLEDALRLFPDNSFPAGRSVWSKPAVNAMKAEVFLWTGKREGGGAADFTTALAALDAITGTDVALLDNFGSIFDYTNKGNREILMAVRFLDREVGNNGYSTMYIRDDQIPATASAATKALIQTGGGGNNWSPSATVRRQFNSDDQRKNASLVEIFTTNATTGQETYFGSVVVKFNGFVLAGLRNFLDDVVLYRYGDVLLMRAEAKNALGQDPTTEMNLIRRRAYGANFARYAFVNGTRAQNDEAILQERLLELIFEGKRWWDLVRFGKAFEKVPSLQSRAGRDFLLLFPISETTRNLSPTITQNPGY